MADAERTGKGKVADYYRDQTVLVTGFTGYLGKQLVEKLLWSCPEVRRIYVLVRSKKGVDPQLRVQQVLQSKAFDRLQKHYPDRLEKVVGLGGDASKERLGMESEVAKRVVQETGVVIHCAASVRFDEPLSSATSINLVGTQWALRLAASMPNLKSFNHVSTAYVNCDRKLMEEKLYPIKMPWRDLLKVTDRLDDGILNILTTKMLGVLPNTYVFTKSLSEHMVVEEAAALGVPLVITRPSVVSPAETEPSPGWVDSIYGPIGISLASAAGVIRVVLFPDPESSVNYVYSDQVVRATLAAPAYTEELVTGMTNVEVPIYHLCSPEWRVYNMMYFTFMTHKAAEELFRRIDMFTMNIYLTHSRVIHALLLYLKHLPAALFIDALLKLAKRQPLLLKLRRKMRIVELTLQYFSAANNQINVSNYLRLNEALQDDAQFYTEMSREIDWFTTVRNSFTSVKETTVFREIYCNPSQTRVYLKSLYYLDLMGELLILSTLGYCIYCSNIPLNILSYLKYFFIDLSFVQ